MSRVCRNGVLAEGDASPGSFPDGAAFYDERAADGGHGAKLAAWTSR